MRERHGDGRWSRALAIAALALVPGCSSSGSNLARDTGPAGDRALPTDRGPGADSTASCDEASTDLVGEITASRTLKRACSPYYLRQQGGAFGATVYGEGVVLTIEAGVQVLADPDVRLELNHGAQLLAGSAAGARIVFERATPGGGAWAGIAMGSSSPVIHELHHVTLRGAKGTPVEAGFAALTVADESETPRVGAVLDDVLIEDPADIGLRVFREGGYLAPGTSGLAVHRAGGYPVVMDAQNLPGLPANQDLTSNDPQKQRVLIFSGNQGSVSTDLVWASQRVPIEMATGLSIGADQAQGSLTISSPQTVLLRKDVGLTADNGTLTAKGDRDCKDTGDCSIVFDAATPGERWGAIIFITGPTNAVASGSVLDRVSLTAGGGTGSTAMVSVVGPGFRGKIGDCVQTATVEGSHLESDAPAGCLAASDSKNPYDTDNGFKGCGALIECD